MRTAVIFTLVGATLAASTVTRAADPPPNEVRMSLERYEELMQKAKRQDGPHATWAKGDVRVTLPGAAEFFARVELTTRLKVVGEGVAEVPVLPGEVVLEAATFDGRNAALVRRGGVQVALLDKNVRDVNVRLQYLVPVRPAAAGAPMVLIPLPPLSSAALTVETGGGDVPVDVWPGANVKRAGNRVTAALPATLGTVVRWGAGALGPAVRRVDYELKLDASGDGVDAVATIEVQTTAELTSVKLAHASAALMDAREGATALTTQVSENWHRAVIEGKGRHRLVATFRMAIDRSGGQPVVDLHLTRAPITRVTTTIPGKRTINYDPKVPLVTHVEGEDDAVTIAIGQLPPSDLLKVGWTETIAAPEDAVRINSESYQLITLEEGVMKSNVHLRYEIISGKAKDLRVEIPEDVVPFRVTGDGVEDWRVFAKTDEEPRHLRVTLSREREGSYALDMELEMRVASAEGSRLGLPVVKPMGVYRERGVIALIDGEKVGFAPVTQSTYTKSGEDAVPVDIRQKLTRKVTQAYKYIGTPGSMSSTVKTTKERELRFDARVHTLYEAKSGALSGRATILVEMKSGKLEKLMLDIPEAATVDNVTAPSLNKAEPAKDYAAEAGRKGHEVRFTRALEGALSIDVEFELRVADELGTVALPDVRVIGAEIEEGAFGITAETAIEVTAVARADLGPLRSADANELPNAVRLRSDREIKLAYLYSHAPWALELEIKRHKTVETLGAEITAAWLETVVFEEGNAVTTALYRVANRSEQFLRLEMPATEAIKADVLAVKSGDELIKAVKDASGALAIPLKKDETLEIFVKYEMRFERLGGFGSVELLAPHPAMRVADLQWVVRTPPDVAVFSIDSTLREDPYDDYRPPDRVMDPQAQATTEGFWNRLFTRAVYVPPTDEPTEEDRLTVGFSYAASGGGPLNILLGLVALLCLALVIYKRARKRPLGAIGWTLVVVGIGALVVKLAFWELRAAEIALGLVVLIVVGFFAWRGGQQEAEA